MEDTFTIPVSFGEFTRWLDDRAGDMGLLPAQVMTLDGRRSATVTAHGAQFAFYLEEDTDDRTTLRALLWSGNEPTPAARQWYADTLQAIRQKWQADAAEPELPPRPGADGATWDDAFDWYHRNRDKCRSLDKLADLIAYTPGAVRNRHAEYQAQRK